MESTSPAARLETDRRAGAAAATVTRVSTATIPTDHGEFTAHVFVDAASVEHLAYVSGEVGDDTATTPHRIGAVPLVRLHSECLTGDVLGSLRCDCGSQLQAALAAIAAADGGVLVYLRGHEGRGIGLGQKLAAYALQDAGLDTVDANLALGFPADGRDYRVGAAILTALGVQQVRLLTNNPQKEAGLGAHGIEIVERIALTGRTTDENLRYLRTKRDRMGHTLAPDLGTGPRIDTGTRLDPAGVEGAC